MATYTPNYNLSKPENTDTQSSFISDYCDNMDKIDANLGGGGGGGGSVFLNTIYTDTEKQIGYWRDNKPLYQITYIFNTPQTVNASPSWFDTGITRNDIEHIVKTDGFRADTNYVLLNGGLNGSNNIVVMQTRPTAITDFKGFTIQYTKTADTPEPNPQFGNVIYLPTIYSDEERQVGVWRDNKPLYAKTYHFASGWVNDSWVDITDLSGLNIDTFVKSDFSVSRINNNLQYTGNGSIRPETSGQDHTVSARYYNNHLQIMVNNYNDIVRLDITIQYTKTTDTAGSGNWNTDGIPTHHYSTNEQVIGTWMGKPLYEKTVFNNGSDITANAGAWTAICSESWVANVKSIINGNLTRQGTVGNVLVTPVEFTCKDGSININPFRNTTYKANGYFTVQYTKTTD